MKKTKACFKCGEVLPISDYYKHKKMADGHLGKCKTCTKADVAARIEAKKNDPEWAFNERERCRKKSIRDYADSKAHTKKQYKRGWKDQDIKKKAASASQHIDCPAGSQNHHWSYKKEHWKDIFIIPIEDHYKIHRYMKYDEEHKQYRTVHGVLLDSRELAETYYNKVLSIKDGVYSELQKLF